MVTMFNCEMFLIWSLNQIYIYLQDPKSNEQDHDDDDDDDDNE